MAQPAPLQKLTDSPDRPRLTLNQVRGFWAAWGGWALDGMDSFIYALVMVPALHELLPRSGIPDTAGMVGFYGGLLFAFFLPDDRGILSIGTDRFVKIWSLADLRAESRRAR